VEVKMVDDLNESTLGGEEEGLTYESYVFPGVAQVNVLRDAIDRLKNRSNETKPDNPLDIQIGGNHYKDWPIQPTEFISRNKLTFLQGNIIKRVCRWNLKGQAKLDIEKAKHELDMMYALEGPDKNKTCACGECTCADKEVK
jgi:hypothetical protein